MKKQGFTLIELLVVISIIGLLSSIVYTSLRNARNKAKIAAGLSFSQSLYHVLGSEAVGVWSFETITGNQTPDGSGNGNDGTIYGNPVQEDSGIPALRQALKFDGRDDYVSNGADGPATTEIAGDKLTIEAWIKPNTLTGTQTIMIKNGPFWFKLSGNKLGDSDYAIHTDIGGWKGVLGNILLTAGDWHHVAMTYDGSNIQLYVNGAPDTSTPKTGNLAGNGCVQIGRYNDGTCDGGVGSYFNGTIDEVRIYRQALTTAEIQKHYAEGLKKFRLSVLK